MGMCSPERERALTPSLISIKPAVKQTQSNKSIPVAWSKDILDYNYDSSLIVELFSRKETRPTVGLVDFNVIQMVH